MKNITYKNTCVFNPDIVVEWHQEEIRIYGEDRAREWAMDRARRCNNPAIDKCVESWEMPRVKDAALLWLCAARGESFFACPYYGE